MATSGSVDSNGYQGRVIRFEWWTESTSGNLRTIGYKFTAVGGSSSCYYHHDNIFQLNGETVYSGGQSDYIETDTILAEGTYIINQNDTSTLRVDMDGGIYVYSNNINTAEEWTLDTLIQAPTINSLSIKSKAINSITISFSCSKSDNWYYKLSSSSSYTQGSTTGVTSGEFTITGLNPNTEYTINFIARNWAGSEAKDVSKDIKGTTYDIGKISSINNFNHGDSMTLTTTNPSGATLSLVMKISNTQILSKTISTGSNTINFSDTELDNIYKLYGSSTSLTATLILTTASKYTNSKTCTITLKRKSKNNKK